MRDGLNENMLTIKSAELFALATELFDYGQNVKILVTGNSMYPFMRHRRDRVELARVPFDTIKTGDIVLGRRRDGAYILHRVFVKEPDSFYMIGDAQEYLDGPYERDQLIAKAVTIFRDGKEIKCDRLGMRALARIWMWLRPVRIKIIRAYIRIRGKSIPIDESETE